MRPSGAPPAPRGDLDDPDDTEALGALTGGAGLGAAALESSEVNEADQTVVAPITEELAKELRSHTAPGADTKGGLADDLRLDASGNPYAEGDEFLRDVSAEFEVE